MRLVRTSALKLMPLSAAASFALSRRFFGMRTVIVDASPSTIDKVLLNIRRTSVAVQELRIVHPAPLCDKYECNTFELYAHFRRLLENLRTGIKYLIRPRQASPLRSECLTADSLPGVKLNTAYARIGAIPF